MTQRGGAWRSMPEHGGAWRSMAERDSREGLVELAVCLNAGC
jgi:hypothetical protein